MSYILNALRKSEQERQAGEVPSLANSFIEHQIKPRHWPAWLVIALVIIIFTLIIFIWLNWQEPQSQSITIDKQTNPVSPNKKPSAAAPDLTENKSLLNATTATINNPPPIQSIAEEPKLSISEIVQKKRQKSIQQQENSVHKEVHAPLPAKSASPLQQKAAKAKEQPSTTVISAAKNLLPAETVTDAAIFMDNTMDETLITETPLSKAKHKEQPLLEENEPNIPKLSELSLEFRRRVPKLNINVFVYADDSMDRFVIIDMIKYTPNAQISEGMELIEILNDSLVVDFRGKTFRIMRP